MKNLEAFKALIKKYESITFKKIKKTYEIAEYTDGDTVMSMITGFGLPETCTLCKAVGDFKGSQDCEKCVYGYYRDKNKISWGEWYPCCDDTYNDLEFSRTPEDTFKALQKRIKYMKKVLKNIEINPETEAKAI